MVYGEIDIENSSQVIPVLGRVGSVTYSDGKMYLQVGDYTLSMDELFTVFSEDEAESIEMPNGVD